MHWRKLSGWVRALNPAQIFARLERRFAPVALSSGVAATIDSVLVDSYRGATWTLELSKTDGTSFRRTIHARHNGTTGADATTVDHGSFGSGAIPAAITVEVDISGATTAQVLRLRVTASEVGWSAAITRSPIKAP
jgi:hypothetical protein